MNSEVFYMIGYLNGKVIASTLQGTVILDVNGVGYELSCSTSLYNRLIANGGGEAFTYLAVRDDGVFLYGFDNLPEKNMFLQLITVSGVGPKMGIAILSSASLSDLAMFIATSDVKSLSEIKGVGKKTAERIIVELREAMQKAPLPKSEVKKAAAMTGDAENAVLALMSLGYNRSESTEAVSRALDNGNTSLEKLISEALRYFAKS